MYSIQHYVTKFVSDSRKVGGFLRVYSSTNENDSLDITEIFLKVALSTIILTPRYLPTIIIVYVYFLGKSLLIANGQKWERNRRLLTPAFHFSILTGYFKIYNEVADTLLVRFKLSLPSL